MQVTLPTLVTLFRVALIPLFVVVFYLPVSWANVAATSIFFVASVSDWVDGYLARIMKQESSFGAFLDPVADKLMVVVIIILLVEAHPSIYMVFNNGIGTSWKDIVRGNQKHPFAYIIKSPSRTRNNLLIGRCARIDNVR